MDMKDNMCNIIKVNEIETEVREDAGYYSSIDTAFDKMSKMQQEITIKKITELEFILSKLEDDLVAMIEKKSANSL